MNPKGSELVECQHVPLQHNCRLCGLVLPESGKAFKTTRYSCSNDDPNSRYLSALRKQAARQHRLKEKYELSEPLFQSLERVAEKFEFTLETLALGIYYFNLLMQLPDKSYRNENIQFVGGSCLIVAAKAIELDKHIPYFSRYQKYASRNHTPQQFQKMEKQIMEEFDWQLQRPTFVSFVHYYLSNGIYFSEDGEKCAMRVYRLEEKVREHCYKALKEGSFVLEEPEKFAANIISDSRKELKLSSWHPSIQHYSGIKATDLQSAEILKPLCPNLRQQNSMVGEHHIKLTLPRLDKNLIERSTSRVKDRIQHVKGALSLRSVPSFNSLNSLTVFGLKKLDV